MDVMTGIGFQMDVLGLTLIAAQTSGIVRSVRSKLLLFPMPPYE